jgi:hypothetical protein
MSDNRPRIAPIALLLAIIVIGGSVVRAILAGDVSGALRIAVGAGIAIVGGLLLAVAIMSPYLPAELQRRRVARAWPSSIVFTARMSIFTGAALSAVSREEHWAESLPALRLSFTASADGSGLSFWRASKPLEPFGRVPWVDVTAVKVLVVEKGQRGKPRLCVQTRGGVDLDFFLSSLSSLGLLAAGRN